MAVEVEKFTPDNVMLSVDEKGNLIQKYTDMVLKRTVEQSIVPAIAKHVPMEKQEVKFSAFLKGVGAYWVGEGQRIQTSKPEFKTLEMKAHKIAVILPVSNEYLDFTDSQFFARMTPEVSKAFALKIDEAIFAGKDNPFAWDLPTAYADKTVKGEINAKNIRAIQGLVEDNDYDVSDFISTRKNRSVLRTVNEVIGNETIRLVSTDGKTLDGSELHETKVIDKGTLIALDRDNMFYGVPRNMRMSLSEDAQLSTVLASDGKPVNLFEQDLVAARFTMDFGFMLTTNEGVSAIVAGESAPK